MQVFEVMVLPSLPSSWRQALLALGSFSAVVIAVGCGSAEPSARISPPPQSGLVTPPPTVGLPEAVSSDPTSGPPDGWSRVQVREGHLGRFAANPLTGFTIDLPPGWKAGESWPSGDVLTGWIAAPPGSLTGKVPMLRYNIGAGPRFTVEFLKQDSRYEVTELELDGVGVVLRLAAPDAIDKGPQIGAYYEQIPGAPDGIVAPSLDIDGDSRGFDDQELLGEILRSVRFSELSSLPGVPFAGASPGSNWVTTAARSGDPNFMLDLPPGWTVTDRWGIDSAIGTITGDGIELSYDFLGGVFDPGDPRLTTGELPAHVVWEELIDGVVFSFVRPVSPEPDILGTTGAIVRFLVDGNDGTVFLTSLPLSASGLNGDQQETALAVLRTVRSASPGPGT